MRPLWLSALVLVGAACDRSHHPTAANSPETSVACATDSLTLGVTLNGDLDSASTCKRSDGFASDSTLTASYGLSVQAGHGYLLTMAGQNLHTLLLLASPTGDTLRASSPTYAGPISLARMLIASPVTETDTVRATTFDTLASDTGAFVITAQACKVPVAPLAQGADSITHTDTVATGDCQVDVADFFDETHAGQVSVHLYAVNFSTHGVVRRVTIDASEPVWVFMGGPHDDTFGALPGGGVQTIDTAATHIVGDFGTGQGDFTLVVAASQPTSYTVTIGAERPFANVTRSSRSRSHPPAVRHRSTPLSVMRRGR